MSREHDLMDLVSEDAALPTDRFSSGHGGGGRDYEGRRRDNWNYHNDNGGRGSRGGRRGGGGFGGRGRGGGAPRKPANQVEREVVFSFSPQVQAMRDIVISLHGEPSADKLHKAVDAYSKLSLTHELHTDLCAVLNKALASLSAEIPIISAFCAIALSPTPAILSILISQLTSSLLSALESQQGVRGIFSAKMILRSIACLTCCGVIAADDVIALMRSLMSVIQPQPTSAQERLHSDVASYLLLSTVPHLHHIFASQQHKHFLSDLSSCISTIKSRWSCPFDVDGVRAIYQTSVVEEGGCRDNLWDATTVVEQMIAALEQRETSPPASAPWYCFQTDAEAIYSIGCTNPSPIGPNVPDMLTSVLQNSSWQPLNDTSAALKSWRNARVCIFDSELGAASAAYAATPLADRHTLAESVRDILVFFEPLASEDGTRIGSVQLSASHLLALSQHHSHKQMHYGVVETLLSALLQPQEHDTVYIGAVLIEMCKLAPGVIPPVIAMGCGVIFQLTPALDSSSWRGVARYLQLHLVNFKMSWPYWSNWEEEFIGAAYADMDAMRCFCRFIVDGCARVMIKDAVQTALPPTLAAIIEINAGPHLQLFDQNVEQSPKSRVATQLAVMINNRDSADVIEDWLDGDHDGIDDKDEDETWKVVLLLQALLHCSGGLLSQTHLLLDTYRDLVRVFQDVTGGQEAMMASLAEVYAHDGGSLNFVLDALLRRSILLPQTVVRWAFSDVVHSLPSDPWLWYHVVLAYERAVDITRAALSIREELINDDKVLSSKRMKIVDSNDQEVIPGLPSMEDDDEEDDAMEEEDGGRRHRRPLKAVDQLTIAVSNKTLLTAANGCRELCALILSEITAAIIRTKQSMASDDELDPLITSLSSLFRAINWAACCADESLHASVAVFLPEYSPRFIVQKDAINGGQLPAVLVKSYENFSSTL